MLTLQARRAVTTWAVKARKPARSSDSPCPSGRGPEQPRSRPVVHTVPDTKPFEGKVEQVIVPVRAWAPGAQVSSL
jgi:hypothetical protein